MEEDIDGRDDDATIAEVGIGARRLEGKETVEDGGAEVGESSATEGATQDGKVDVDEGGKDARDIEEGDKATADDNDTATGGIVKEDPRAVDGVTMDGVSFRKRRPMKTP